MSATFQLIKKCTDKDGVVESGHEFFRSAFTPSANLNLFILCLFLIKRKPVQLNYHLLDKLMQDDRVRDL